MDGGGLSLTNREIDGPGGRLGGGELASSGNAPRRSSPAGSRRAAQNWAIGCWGQFVGDGRWQTPNEFVKPDSLYRAQLAERLGPGAVANLDAAADPDRRRRRPVDRRGPRPDAAREAPAPARPLALRDGWLESRRQAPDRRSGPGRPGGAGTSCPAGATEFGVGVTRFVPGRDGPGFTDDLDELTDAMVAGRQGGPRTPLGPLVRPPPRRPRDGPPARRRRLAPVLRAALGPERPGGRLGRPEPYDLTRSTPGTSAGSTGSPALCDRKGLVLLHQAYFQHNILEAGAHWADFPWRPANCLQATGFPEPPPYAGKKRIFMADAFYDVTHPVRRRLHRLYIRKCLDILGAHPNVIFLTGEEYTGPLEFVRFWLDTVDRMGARDGPGRPGRPERHEGRAGRHPRRPGPGPRRLRDRDEVLVVHRRRQPLRPRGRQEPRPQAAAPRVAREEPAGRTSRPPGRSASTATDTPTRRSSSPTTRPTPGSSSPRAGSMPDLPAGIDPRLLAALPRMAPVRPPGGRSLGPRRPGPALPRLSRAAGEPVRLDLSADPCDASRSHRIDPGTGRAAEPRRDRSAAAGSARVPGRGRPARPSSGSTRRSEESPPMNAERSLDRRTIPGPVRRRVALGLARPAGDGPGRGRRTTRARSRA